MTDAIAPLCLLVLLLTTIPIVISSNRRTKRSLKVLRELREANDKMEAERKRAAAEFRPRMDEKEGGE